MRRVRRAGVLIVALSERTVYGANGKDVTMVEIANAAQDSVELSVNAKGEPSWSIKAYGRDADDLTTRLGALRALAEMHAAQIRAGKGA